MKIYAMVSRGPQKGEVVTPHLHSDGTYIVSPTRFARDYKHVSTLDEFVDGLRQGLSGRMSSKTVNGPRLFSPSSIRIEA